MNIRLAILAPEAAKYQGYAEQELYKLEAKRQINKRPSMRKVFKVGQVFILIYTTPRIHKILMWGGATPLILLSNYVSSFGYDYYQDSLLDAPTPDGVPTSYPLSPIYNGRSQFADYAHITYQQGWTTGDIGNNYTFLGGVNDYEMAFFVDGQDIYGRVGESIGQLATIDDTLMPDYAKPYGALFSLPAYKPAEAWNLYRGVIQYTLNPANQNINDSWYWQPSFFTAQPADDFGLAPGFYYGHYPSPVHTFEDEDGAPFALTSAEVSLKAILDTRYVSDSGDYNYGWAEVLKTVDGEGFNKLYIYLQDTSLPVYQNSTFGYYRISGTIEDMTITVGSDLQGFEASTSIDLVTGDENVDMWNFNIWVDPGALLTNQDTGVGIAVVEDSNAKFYRFTGGTATVYETDKYHSHSTSRDGTILAVFEGSGELITGVQVFDLYGAREATQGSEYTSGGFTQLRVDGNIVSAEALTGCVIPFRAEDFTPSIVSYELEDATPAAQPADYTDYLSALAMVTFFKRGTAPPTIRKVTCENGIDASYAISEDECFDSVFILEDPDLGVNQERLTGWWDAGGIFKGVVRGKYEGEAPNIKFVGEGEPWIAAITRPEEFQIIEGEDGTLTFDGYIGEITVGDCITTNAEGEYIPDTTCADCDGLIEMTATSSCGQEGSGTSSIEIAELTLTGTDTPVQWDRYTAAGGTPPYTFYSDQGTYDKPNATQMRFTDVTGTCGSGIVRVTDACGNTAELTVRWANGQWITHEWHVGPSFGGSCVDYRDTTWYDDGGTCKTQLENIRTACGVSGAGYTEIDGDTKTEVGSASTLRCGTVNDYTSTTTINNGGTCADGTRYNYPYNAVSYVPSSWPYTCTYETSCTDHTGTHESCNELWPCYVTIYKWVCPC